MQILLRHPYYTEKKQWLTASNKSEVPAIAALGKDTFELKEELTYAFSLHRCILLHLKLLSKLHIVIYLFIKNIYTGYTVRIKSGIKSGPVAIKVVIKVHTYRNLVFLYWSSMDELLPISKKNQ